MIPIVTVKYKSCFFLPVVRDNH